MSEKKIKTATVSFDEFSEWDFVPPGSYYIRNAMGEYVFLKTSERKLAQAYIDEHYGKGKYAAIPAKNENTVSRLESGEFSCTGTSTRRGQKR